MDDDLEGDEIGTIEGLLEGDGFINEEIKEEETARKRRFKRKRRLESMQKNQMNEPLMSSIVAKKLRLEKSSPAGSIQLQQTGTKYSLKEESNAFCSTISTPPRVSEVLENHDCDKRYTGTGEFDMFSGSVSPPSRVPNASKNHDYDERNRILDQQQDWDDVEGYYKAAIGEKISVNLTKNCAVRFRVSGVVGKGVFSTVLKCVTESSNSSTVLPPQVALKFIRHNDTMANAAVKEVKILQRLRNSLGVISLLLPSDSAPLEYRGHTILAFPHMEYNLRDLLKKYGQGLGLSLTAVTSYFRQLLAALTQLQKHNVIHSDLKPDNILVSADFSSVSICDFGSAIDSQESGEMVTPYLVSRFYRAPEIILGLIPTYAIDLWGIAVTVAELFLGKVVFNGSDNNDMLKMMMEVLGPFSNRLIRQHLVQAQKFPLKTHFSQEATTFVFRQATVDPVTGQAVHKDVSLQSFTPSLQSRILRAKSGQDSRTSALRFAEILQKCMTLDPTRRISVKDAIHHDVFKTKK
ncbi:unnamed protein product [Cylindrotheca closterium]|uniref:Protein kinase domain-containing protein n=1 Tax=Cylindrotheca closterium TaxID=2856 RepID=A0AAD2CTC9_9STRA|nr:unnamed protein product [Cylindrotheca closterium]